MSVHVTGAECAVTFTGSDAVLIAAMLADAVRAHPRSQRLPELLYEARKAAEGYAAEHRRTIAAAQGGVPGPNRFRTRQVEASSGTSEWITTDEAAQRLHRSTSYVRRLARQGRLRARRDGRGAWEIDAADVATWDLHLSA